QISGSSTSIAERKSKPLWLSLCRPKGRKWGQNFNIRLLPSEEGPQSVRKSLIKGGSGGSVSIQKHMAITEKRTAAELLKYTKVGVGRMDSVTMGLTVIRFNQQDS
ncbi:hypothetical protein AVEN_238262-2-1, partial [Araneus ventricosus]